MAEASASEGLVEHAFRHEYGRLVATLTRSFGFHRVEAIEDAAQAALLAALYHWTRHGTPRDASAWLYRTAKNKLLDELRAERRRAVPLDPEGLEVAGSAEPSSSESEPSEAGVFEKEIADAELRMLFACAEPSVPRDSQLVLALKILCGFSTQEIALRLLTTEENVQKRLSRGREQLRNLGAAMLELGPAEFTERLGSVEQMIYLLFNEGYGSASADRLIRRELCEEALRLTSLLVDGLGEPSSEALLALMLLHAARFDARVDGNGGLLLLEAQDRRLWDGEMIRAGLEHLGNSGRGQRFSRYHAEAAIAAEHCVAPTYEATRWPEIVSLYELLERLDPSPLHTLNKAIALSEWRGAAAGLTVLEAVRPPSWLTGYYLWDATLGELLRRRGDLERARVHLSRALEMAPHPAERALIERRLRACDG
jgi:RNA polymerase sigma-70 factor (ECF subfamily)